MKPVYYCRRCEAEIPHDVDECPHCGYYPQSIVWRFGVGALIFGGALALVAPHVGLSGFSPGSWRSPEAICSRRQSEFDTL